MGHTIQELRIRQALPLEQKILMTKARIREWVDHYGLEGVYVSFSGGKDSTVLLHIARSIYPDIKAVFVDTGLEYPEVREFVKTFENVDIIRPKMNFRQVIEKYGYPFISKEVSHKLHDYRTAKQNGRDSYVEKQFKGEYITRNGKTNKLDISKYYFMTKAPFKCSHYCCNIMKKQPTHKYTKDTGRYPLIALLAEESFLRTQKWLKEGCNAFENKYPTSTPLSFWLEQDIYKYLIENNVKITSVYGEIVPDYSKSDEIDGQMDISELGLIEDNRKYKTTGCTRTGCMFCGFGCHLEKSPNRFELMKITHPKQYDYIMRPKEQGGLGYKEVIDWINANSDLNIKY